MIKTRKDLKLYLENDRKRNLGQVSLLEYWLLLLYGVDKARAYRYLKALRYYEYYMWNRHTSFLMELAYIVTKLKYNRLCIKYDIVIKPNTVGYGLYLPHISGGGIIISCDKMGNNCVCNVGVVVGNKQGAKHSPIIGNNVDLTTGCKVIGSVVVGDNVIIAPNSVVVKDVPSNAIVSGIPSKIIKMRKE